MTKKNPWFICAAGTLLLFCTVGLSVSSFSVYQPYMIRDIGLTNSESSLYLTVRTLSGLCSTFLVQAYLGRVGLRRGVCLAGMCTAAAFMALSMSKGFASACVAAVMMGIGYGLGGTVSVSIIIHRVFDLHMGLALSICTAGTGAAMIVCPPVVTWLIKSFSLRTSLVAEGCFIAFAVVLVFFVLNGVPEGGMQSKAQTASAGLGGVKTLMCLASMLFIGTIGNTGWSHLGVLYSTAGFSPERVALLISLVGMFLTFGKLAFGECADLFGSRWAFSVSYVAMVIGLVLSCLADTGSMVAACGTMVLLGLSLPISTVGPGFFAEDIAPDKFDAMVKRLQLAYMIGSLIYGPFPGIIADRCGSYVPAYVILTGFAVIATLLFFFVYKDIPFGRKKK